ncbi:TKL protein kinase, variant [Aphanomyces invadans]|nr:TKL protein kinase, variant [Aphanomyces invadans]ETW02374.1 TKL protein kinase, variant [Aphanomyces invadans]|eukprot:XP_008868979.1 TKL protein kinase, variant [Aphanomyces invadans]
MSSTTPCDLTKTILTVGQECPLTCQQTGSNTCVLYKSATDCTSVNAKSGPCVTQSDIVRSLGTKECLLTFQCPTMGNGATSNSTQDPFWNFYVGDPAVGSGNPLYVGAPIEAMDDLTKTTTNRGGNFITTFQVTGTAFNQPKGTFKKISYPPTFFSKYPKLERLFLFNMDVKDVFANAMGDAKLLPDLKFLAIVNANLDVLPTEVTKLTRLQFLNATNNNLASLPPLDTTELTELYLGGNAFTSITNIPASVTKLDLSRNKFTTVPPAIFDLAKLDTLVLTGNGLTNVVLTPDQVRKLSALGKKFEADFTVTKCPEGSGFNPAANPLINAVGGVRVCVVGEPNVALATPTPSPTTVDSGLSSGALIGIIVGVAVVLALAAFVMFRKRRTDTGYHTALDPPTKGYNVTDPSGQMTYPYPSSGSLGILDDPELLAVRINAAEVTEIQMISRGGFGEVWSGIYQNNPVAIKKLLPDKKNFDDAMMFAAEIKLMARLQHPKIVKFIGASWSNAINIQAISEYMNCGDLKSLLDRSVKSGQELPWLTVKLNLAIDVSDALVYLHTLNPVFVHRDLKSRNILIDADSGAKLSDFGISRNRTADETMTAGVGTCRWMAPEVIRGDK